MFEGLLLSYRRLMSIRQHVANLDTLILFLFPWKESVALQREAAEELHRRQKPLITLGRSNQIKEKACRSKEIRQTECDMRVGSPDSTFIHAGEGVNKARTNRIIRKERKKEQRTENINVQIPPL